MEDLLERFAAGPLSPDADTLARGRSVTIAAAERHTRSEPSGSRGRLRAGSPSFAFGLGRSRRPKLFAALAAVAILLMATVGVAAESGPGQPFYHLKLNVEAIGLPAAGSSQRAQVDLSRAQARLDEIAGKAKGSDWKAAADAADAYAQVVASMSTPAPGAAGAAYRATLQRQLALLESLRATSHGDESEALDTAIARLKALLGENAESTPRPSPTACDTPGHGHSGNGNGSGNENGNGNDGRNGGSGRADASDCQTPAPAAGPTSGSGEGPRVPGNNGSSGPDEGGQGGSAGPSPEPTSTPHGNSGSQPDGTNAPPGNSHHVPDSPEPSHSPD
jgi:hypothetical protein